jgi:biopolymer transport protein ExbB/TolQ
MTGPQSPAAAQASSRRRSATTVAAFVIGLPLAAGILYAVQRGMLGGVDGARYVHHPVEKVEVVMFCCAVGALAAKLWRTLAERAAFRVEALPPWDGKPAPVSAAGELLAGLQRLPRRFRNTYLGNRVGDVLDFLRSRGSANELDDQLRALADNDAVALEGSYSLTRFITWAIPILGFLGTVLGITGAISGVTPEVLEKDLSRVTDGLALAFDTTALGLALTMATMFFSFVVERLEQGTLDAVDRYVDRNLAHRFERAGAEGGDFIGVVRQNTQVLVQATEQLVQRQADVWAKAFDQSERQRAGAEDHRQQRLTAALGEALEKTLEAHARRLAALEKQALDQGAGILERMTALATAVREAGREQEAALARVGEALAAKAEALAQLQDGEKQLLRLQDTLNQNLAAVAGTGAFEEAVHSLTAAIHLLTVKSGEHRGSTLELKPGLRKGPGAAA